MSPSQATGAIFLADVVIGVAAVCFSGTIGESMIIKASRQEELRRRAMLCAGFGFVLTGIAVVVASLFGMEDPVRNLWLLLCSVILAVVSFRRANGLGPGDLMGQVGIALMWALLVLDHIRKHEWTDLKRAAEWSGFAFAAIMLLHLIALLAPRVRRMLPRTSR